REQARQCTIIICRSVVESVGLRQQVAVAIVGRARGVAARADFQRFIEVGIPNELSGIAEPVCERGAGAARVVTERSRIADLVVNGRDAVGGVVGSRPGGAEGIYRLAPAALVVIGNRPGVAAEICLADYAILGVVEVGLVIAEDVGKAGQAT